MKTLPTQSSPLSEYRALFERRHAVPPAYAIGCLMDVRLTRSEARDRESDVQSIESGSASLPPLRSRILSGLFT